MGEGKRARFVVNIVWRVFLHLCAARCDATPSVITLVEGCAYPSAGEVRATGLSTARAVETSESAVCGTLWAANAAVDCTCRGALIRRWGEKEGGEGRRRRATVSRRYPGICAGRSRNAHRMPDFSWLYGIDSLAKRTVAYEIAYVFRDVLRGTNIIEDLTKGNAACGTYHMETVWNS